MNPLIVIAGPTAVGKTELGMALAEALKTEIISADSMQVYKYLDIGTAKPTLDQQVAIKHHLIDLVEPNQAFSVADYQNEFHKTAQFLLEKNKIPIVVGGTGLYIRACTQSFVFEPSGANPELRLKLRKEADQFGSDFLHQRLGKIDPVSAQRIHPNDLLRIIRALEVYDSSGVPISAVQPLRNQEYSYQVIYIFIDRERPELYDRIEKRVDQMMVDGLVVEVEQLYKMGFSQELKPMQSLGYRQVGNYLSNKNSLEEAIADIKKETRHYAKRQLTWFRREPIDLWLNLSGRGKELIGEILYYIEGRFAQVSNKLS